MNSRFTIKKNSDFHGIYSKGKNAVSREMVVYCKANKLGITRVGYTASVKLGGAVVRNRIKRRLREVFRLNSSNIASGYDIIIVARSHAINADFQTLEAVFLSKIAELGIIK